MLTDSYPDVTFEFINRGISGNRTEQLLARLDKDLIELQPDIVSILIGINDVWHRYEPNNIQTADANIEANYRTILTRIRKETDAKIMLISPFLLYSPNKAHMREEVDRVIAIVKRLADEFADIYLPMDAHFASVSPSGREFDFYSGDGVHPNQNGACLIGEHYLHAIAPLIDACKATHSNC